MTFSDHVTLESPAPHAFCLFFSIGPLGPIRMTPSRARGPQAPSSTPPATRSLGRTAAAITTCTTPSLGFRYIAAHAGGWKLRKPPQQVPWSMQLVTPQMVSGGGGGGGGWCVPTQKSNVSGWLVLRGIRPVQKSLPNKRKEPEPCSKTWYCFLVLLPVFLLRSLCSAFVRFGRKCICRKPT